MKQVKVIYKSQPRLVREILLETGICRDEFKAEQFLKNGAVIIGRISAHSGMTVQLTMGEPVQLSIYDERYSLMPVTQEEFLETGNPNARWSEDAIKTSWQN